MGHSSLRLSLSKTNINVQPAVGQVPMSSPISTARCSVSRSYRAAAASVSRQRLMSAGAIALAQRVGSTVGQRSCDCITLPASTFSRTYALMQSSQKWQPQLASETAVAGSSSHMQIGHVIAADGRAHAVAACAALLPAAALLLPAAAERLR